MYVIQKIKQQINAIFAFQCYEKIFYFYVIHHFLSCEFNKRFVSLIFLFLLLLSSERERTKNDARFHSLYTKCTTEHNAFDKLTDVCPVIRRQNSPVFNEYEAQATGQ